MATDFKLPFSAGAETSSVSFDPRRQVAPAGEEVTQVTQSGGRPALDVGSTIDAQFADAGDQAASADAFADGPPGNTQNDLDARTAQYVDKRKAVHKEYAKKSLDQKKLKDKHAQDQLNKLATKKMLANRKANQQASLGAQAKRRKMWDGINLAEGKRQIAQQAKVTTVKTTNARTVETKTTNVKDTTVKDANLALVADPSKDPSKKPL